jgi:hypothetical protein
MTRESLVYDIELTAGGSVLDRVYRAEKRCWVNASECIRTRELRNLIAHEYATEKMSEINATVGAMAPQLLCNVSRVTTYVHALLQRYP